MLRGVLSSTFQHLLVEYEAEKARLEVQLAIKVPPPRRPHPAAAGAAAASKPRCTICAALNDESINTEATQGITQLLESVTIHPAGPKAAEAQVLHVWRSDGLCRKQERPSGWCARGPFCISGCGGRI